MKPRNRTLHTLLVAYTFSIPTLYPGYQCNPRVRLIPTSQESTNEVSPLENKAQIPLPKLKGNIDDPKPESPSPKPLEYRDEGIPPVPFSPRSIPYSYEIKHA